MARTRTSRGVVVGVDDNSEAQHLVEAAADWSVQLHEPLTVLTVAEPVPPPLAAGPVRRRYGPDGDVDLALRVLLARLRRDDVEIEPRVLYDPIGPVDGIVAWVHEHPSMLLVVGTAAPSGLERLAKGSTAAAIGASIRGAGPGRADSGAARRDRSPHRGPVPRRSPSDDRDDEDRGRLPELWKKNRVPAATRGKPQCSNCHHPLPWIVDADDSTFAEVADQATLPVLVDLWAPWCGPCRMVSPVLESLAQQLAGRVKLVKVNVDESPALAQRFQARGIPMLLVLQEGRIVAEQVGAAPEQVLRPWLEHALADASTQRAREPAG